MSIYSTYRFIKQADPLNVDFSPMASNPQGSVTNLKPIESNLNTLQPVIGGSTYFPTDTIKQKDVVQGKFPWVILPQDKNIPGMWDSMRNVANKAHLMQWWLSNKGTDTIAPFQIMGRAPLSEHFEPPTPANPNGMTRFNHMSVLPTIGHEWGHYWHLMDNPSDFYGVGTSSGSNPLTPIFGKRDTLNREFNASYRYLPEHLDALRQTNPTLYDRFLRYANNTVTPAYQGYALRLSRPPEAEDIFSDEYKAFEAQLAAYKSRMEALYSSPQVQRMDDDMYNVLLREAIKQGYDPSLSWGRDPRYRRQPVDLLMEDKNLFRLK